MVQERGIVRFYRHMLPESESICTKEAVDFSGSPLPDREIVDGGRVRSVGRLLKFLRRGPMSSVKGRLSTHENQSR